VDSYVKRLSPNQTARKRLRQQCCVDWALLRLIIREKKLKVNMRWVKGHATNKENNIADRHANSASNAFALGMVKPSVMKPGILDKLDIRPLWDGPSMVNEDYLKRIRECVSGKHAILVKDILHSTHRDLPADVSIKMSLSPPGKTRAINDYCFRLRTAAGYLPTLTLVATRKRKKPPDKCPGCDNITQPNAKHIFTTCNISSRLELRTTPITTSVIKNANATLLIAGLVTKKTMSDLIGTRQLAICKETLELSKGIFTNIWKPYNTKRKAAEVQMTLEDDNTPPTRPYPCLRCRSTLSRCSCSVYDHDNHARQLANDERLLFLPRRFYLRSNRSPPF
jgi:hypothetical protein